MFGIRARFLFFLFIAAALPPVTALIVTRHYANAAKIDFEHRLTRTSRALQSQTDAEAARRSELLLKLERLPALAEPIHEAATANQPAPAAAATRLHDAIAESFPREAPTLMAVATKGGAQVVLGNAAPVPVEVQDLPSAATALSGQSVQVFALYKDTLYRFAAMPVGVAEGALIIGEKIGDSSAMRWREAVQAEVTLVVGGKSIVSSAKGDLKNAVAELSKHPTTTLSTGHSGLGWPQLGFLDRFLPIGVPNPAEGSVGVDLHGALGVVTIPTESSWMGGVQALGFIGGLFILVLGLIWMQMIYGPVYRQSRSIEAHLARLKVERNARLTTKGFSSPFAAVVEHLDKLTEFWNLREAQLQAAAAQAPRDAAAAPAATAVETPRAVIARPQVALPLEVGPAKEPESIESAFPFGENYSGKTSRVKPEDDTAESVTPAAVPKTAKPPTPSPAPKPSSNAAPTPRVVTAPRGTVAVAETELSGPLVPLPGAQRGPPPRGPSQTPAPITDADLPPDLLARSQELEEELLAPAEDPEEEHFRSVFDEFVAVRRRCGEPADGLTFEKFQARLQKNRDQLIEKFACKTVRFQVYVKDGKAAVKALPVH